MNKEIQKYMELKRMCEDHKIKPLEKEILNNHLEEILNKKERNLLNIIAYGSSNPLAITLIEVLHIGNPYELLKKHNINIKNVVDRLSNEFLVSTDKIFLLASAKTSEDIEVAKKLGGTEFLSAICEEFDATEDEVNDALKEISDRRKEINNKATVGSLAKKLVDMIYETEELDDNVKEKILEKMTEAMLWFEYGLK